MFSRLIKFIIVSLIKLYQATVALRQPNCRFTPTCSHYAVEAVDLHGPWQGSWLAIKRLLRCHPLSGKHGYDPVPQE
ncbi:MAG: membrane protein insertion efficiency factor YidD [Candidatus Melainabacteria bacterium]|nr:membrane protein insertion efficiency factor YidD [Candidatus Melainabacteria bacterium]